jgi:hypothetical protein
MHSVAQTHAFVAQANAAGMTEAEIDGLVLFIAENPDAGDVIQGTGGCRKIRVAGRGRGKSGGYRTITFFSGDSMPVFLLAAFGKGERSDLTQKERNALRDITKVIVEAYKARPPRPGGRKGV